MNLRPVHVIAVGMLCVLGLHTAGAQSNPKSFKFPHGVNSGDYVHQSVLVKLKPDHRNLFGNAGGHGATLSSAPGFAGAKAMIPERANLAARSRRGPRRASATVDIGLYYRLRCEPGTSIETFINNLYQTGHFERVEPEYINHLAYTPNDPSVGLQYYLTNIRAYEAWNVTHGSSSIVIGIVDSGGQLDHEDLAANVYNNPLDPPGGGDEDGNNYIDDFRGWDFVGDALSNLDDPSFLGDNNPQIVGSGVASHGVSTAGCASAVTDNAKGIAGVGFNTKIMWTKHSADNQLNGTSIYLGYDGMLYAAERGVDIINLSWGGPFRSEIIQDLVTYITDDLGILIVAAAGNAGVEDKFYPAAYDGVLSVSAVNQSNVKANFSNFGSWVDLAAPGVAIYTTSYNGYTSIQGTSFSSPITAGAAALVMAQFPSYSPRQLAEQIRVSADAAKLNAANPALVGRMGYGVLDIYSALTKVSPAVRAFNPKLLNANGGPAQQGEMGFLTLNFKNILAATSPALEITVSENSLFMTVNKGTIRPGAIGSGASINNKLNPFEIQIAVTVPDNFEVPVTISYTDGTYSDQEVVTFLLNPTFIDVDENLVTTTVSNTARIGYEDAESDTRLKGSGFVFDGNSILYEMGVIMGTGTGAQLYNNVRGINSTYDQDFKSIGTRITEVTPGVRSTSEIVGSVSNSTTGASQAFQLTYRSLAWKEAPYDKFVIMEYTVNNPTASTINNFYLGLFADWDITVGGATDHAEWEVPLKLGYVYPIGAAGLPHAGIQLLTNGPQAYFAIDNNQATAGNPFGLYDGFTDTEKFQTISTGLARVSAGGAGADVSHVVGSGPFSIPAGQQIKIAFALHAAPNMDDLFLSAKYADSVYNYTLNAPKPVVPDANACYGAAASITATGASSFKWYKDFTGGTSFFTGSNFVTPTLFNDTTYYVSNAEESYESVRTPAHVLIKANPKVSVSGSLAVCDNEKVTLSAEPADTYLWSNGATTQAIHVSTPASYSVTVSSLNPVCQNVSDPVVITNVPAPTADFDYHGDLASKVPIEFTDHSTSASSWNWDFGDGTKSTLQNPTVTYVTGDTYEILLIVQAANGCRDSVKQTLDVILGLHPMGDPSLGVFPNPTSSVWYVSVAEPFAGPKTVELLTLQGRTVFQATTLSARIEIPAADYPDGLYIIRVAYGDRVVNRKVLKAR